MLLKGDISTFHPSNLLIFFSDFNREFLLTVHTDTDVLNITLKGTRVLDAQSNHADEKLLRAIFYRKLLNKKQLNHIYKTKKETKVPVRLIIEDLKLFPIETISDDLKNAMLEVLFQLFLLKTGPFHITDVSMGYEPIADAPDCREISAEISRWIDEWQDIERSITSIDRVVALPSSESQPENSTPHEKIILNLAKKKKPIREIVNLAPLPSFQALKAVNSALVAKSLVFSGDNEVISRINSAIASDQLFFSFKASLKKILLSTDIKHKMSELIAFCKDLFDKTLVMTLNGNELKSCMAFLKDEHGVIQRKDIRDLNRLVDGDPIFQGVLRSGLSFFGKLFPTDVTKGIIPPSKDGECAIIPLLKKDSPAMLIYVILDNAGKGLGMFHYLELLTWLIHPPTPSPEQSTAIAAEAVNRQQEGASRKKADPSIKQKFDQLIEIMENLPPIPHVVAQVLDLLANPDCSILELSRVLTFDPVLVAQLLKVSNSALYSRGQPVSNLQEALNRLGTKTIKSIVMTASINSLFPQKNTKMGNLSNVLWKHSKECGITAKRVAEALKYREPEEAFLGGVLHDIGKLVILLKLSNDYEAIVTRQESNGISSYMAEKEILGFDHTQIGAVLMKKWGMPQGLLQSVRYHHQPENAQMFKPLADTISYSDRLSHLIGAINHSDANEDSPEEFEKIYGVVNEMGLSHEKGEALIQLIRDDFKHTTVFD